MAGADHSRGAAELQLLFGLRHHLLWREAEFSLAFLQGGLIQRPLGRMPLRQHLNDIPCLSTQHESVPRLGLPSLDGRRTRD